MDSDQRDSCYRGDTAETLAWRVAELEQENARLKAERDFFDRLLKSTPVFVFTITPEFQITYLNHFRDDCHDQPTGMYVRDFATPEDAQLLESAITRAFEQQCEQMVCIRSETTGRMLQTWYAPMKTNDGPPLVVGVSLDVTEEHDKLDEILQSKDKIAEELAESDQRLEIMVDSTPVPVSISDIETGQILYGNQALSDFFTIPYELLKEQISSDYYAEPAQRNSLLDRLARGEPIRGNTVKMKNRNGEILHAALYLNKIRYAQRPAILACFLDISAHKLREEGILRDRMALRRLLDTNERDRRLIAYEIHDGVVQDMTGALMFLQTGTSLISQEVDGQSEVRRGTQLLSNAIGEIRRLLNGLRPLSLEDGGVVAAIDDLVTRMMEENFAIDFHHDIEFTRLAPSLEMAVYRTVQEAVNNARRHSQEDSASIVILQKDKSIQISVRDEGCGFDPTEVDPRRCGLSGIYERANLLGGKARIVSSPGQGTLVKVILPLGDYLESE